MRRPKLQDFDEDDGNGPDFEAYTDMMDHYGDVMRDEQIERMWDEGDQIHEQRKDEKDEEDD